MSSVVRVTAVFEMLVEDGLKIAPPVLCCNFYLFDFDCYDVDDMVLFSFYCLKKVACMVNCELSLGRSTVVVTFIGTSYFYLPKEPFMVVFETFPIELGAKPLSSFRFICFLPMLPDY